MDAISHRIKKVAESVLENEALIGGLDKSTAEVLQGWGVRHATRAAEGTHSLDDESAEKAMYPQLKASRRLLRAIRVWLEHEKEATAEEIATAKKNAALASSINVILSIPMLLTMLAWH